MADGFRLTDAQLSQFGEQGYVGPLPSPWGREVVESLVRVANECLARPGSVYDCRYESLDPGPARDGETEARRRRRVEISARSAAAARDRHLESRPLFDALRHPAIVERAAQIVGPDLLLWRSQLFPNQKKLFPLKDDSGGKDPVNIPWHQEIGYMGTTGRRAFVGGENLSLWMALTPCNTENGTLRVVPGSHRLGQLAVRQRRDRVGVFEHEGFVEDVDFRRAADLEFAPGQFVLFDDYLLHGSRENPSPFPRLGLSARYASPTIHLFKRTHDTPPGLLQRHDTQRPTFPRLVYPLEDETHDNWGLPLTRWGCLLVRGEDRYGWNRMASPPPEGSSVGDGELRLRDTSTRS